MKQTTKERINELISSLGVSKNKFAKMIGTSSAMISKVTTQEINFGVDLAEKIISTFPSVSPTWLLTGIGEMMLPEAGSEPHLKPHFEPHLSQKGGKVAARPETGNNSPGTTVGDENDHLFGQNQPKRPRTPEEEEKLAQVREVLERHPDMGSEAYIELSRIRHNPDYAHTARKLHELRERLKFDLQKNDPELLALTQSAELTSHLISDLRMVQMRYFGLFAEAQQSFSVAGRPLAETPIEELQYPEYREAMVKVANALRPFSELISIYNTKMQEILNASGPADSDNLIQGYLL